MVVAVEDVATPIGAPVGKVVDVAEEKSAENVGADEATDVGASEAADVVDVAETVSAAGVRDMGLGKVAVGFGFGGIVGEVEGHVADGVTGVIVVA
jgi:hypothetical protein